MPAILTQGISDLRDAFKDKITHFGIATDQTAFSASQTALDPANGGAANLLIKTATKTNVNASTFDASMTINGDSEFTGKSIWTEGALKGSSRTDCMARVVRSAAIGVIAGDSFTVGIRFQVTEV